jgi:hypothetical protein
VLTYFTYRIRKSKLKIKELEKAIDYYLSIKNSQYVEEKNKDGEAGET